MNKSACVAATNQVRNSMPFDTHAAVKTLVAAGASEELAEAIVVVVAQEVSLAAELPPSAADLAKMSDTEVINQIVKSGQPGNSALAEMQRRFSVASYWHGVCMLILTVVILIFTVVQACNVVGMQQRADAPEQRNDQRQELENSAGAGSQDAEPETQERQEHGSPNPD